MKKSLLGVSTLALLACAGSAWAQATDTSVSEVIVTGTRQTGVKAADSAAPIQLVANDQLLRTGSNDLADALLSAVPSLDISTSVGDAGKVHILASLRGLSPNDTLILVNGQRRHTTSNISVDSGSNFTGSATTDLNYIPTAAIDHIEVLTDGAAAQYGSDAIAGVVNIILKKNSSGGVIVGDGGDYFSGQGATESLSFNQGFNLNDKGFVNVTLEERTQAHTVQGCGDLRFQSANCQLLPVGGGAYASAVNLADITKAQAYPHENQVNGAPQYAIYNSFFNAGYNLTPDIQLYGFGNFSYNASEHYENYRQAGKVGACLDGIGSFNKNTGVCTGGTAEIAVPTGFDPSEKYDETDYSITAGAKGTEMGWNWNLATTYGENSTKVYVINTDNLSTFVNLQDASATPVSYPTHTLYDGSYDATEWDGKLDLDRAFNVGLAAPLNVAVGAEGRRDTYAIGAGEPESYLGFGAESFIGYYPQNVTNASRTNEAVYVDLATKPITNLSVDAAFRYENFSDFGSTKTGKFTARYDFSPAIAIRGTISNGFRAPTLAEEYYNGLNVGPTSVSAQEAPNSPSAAAAGFQALKPEQSINYSGGLVLHPLPKLQITVDAYYILMHDRITNIGGLYALNVYCVPNSLIATTPNNGTPSKSLSKSCPTGQAAEDVIVAPGILTALDKQGVSTAGLTDVGVSAFGNAANTRTGGVDMTGTYASDFGTFGHVDWTVGFNYNHTQISKNANLPSILYNSDPAIGINQTQSLTPTVESGLTTATPREKLILQGFWRKGPWSVNLRETVYNDMKELLSTSAEVVSTTPQKYFGVIPTTGITDLDVGYKFNRFLKVDIGANNLFNIKPPLIPNTVSGQPLTGDVYNVPYGFSPFGSDGGFYYGRVTLTY